MKKKTNKNERPLFFTFPDGVLHYDCAECSALCCKGQGIGSNLKHEGEKLLKLYPTLGFAANSRQGDIVHFSTPAGRCFFLTNENQCRIELEHGKFLKPGVCSLFPFNAITPFKDFIAVSPHFLCPLRLQFPARPGYVTGTHSDLEKTILESGWLDQKSWKGKSTTYEAPSLFKREVSFRDACTKSMGKKTFRSLLKEFSESPKAFDAFLEKAVSLWGLQSFAEETPRDIIDDSLLALASTIRLQFTKLGGEEVLWALALAEYLIRQMRALTQHSMSLQAMNSILQANIPTLLLFTRGERKLKWISPKEAPHLKFSNPHLTLASFQAISAIHSSENILSALQDAVDKKFSSSDRSIFFLELGRRIEWELATQHSKIIS